MEADGKAIQEALLDLMEDFAIQGDEASAKECLREYLKIREGGRIENERFVQRHEDA